MCIAVSSTNILGEYEPYSLTPKKVVLPNSFTLSSKTTQVVLVEERWAPTERDNHAFIVKYPEETSEKEKLTVKQIVAKFNVGKTQKVWHMIKAKSVIKNEWLNCGIGSMKWKQHKSWN